jgi:hypothetical protein
LVHGESFSTLSGFGFFKSNGRNGSEAAKVALLERMAASRQKAELIQACFSVLF